MKKFITAFIAIGILGSLWHFFYEWSGNNYFVGLFSPVNEGVWEHLKLIFWPVIIYFLFERFVLYKNSPLNIFVLTMGIFSGMFAIVSSFYTYSGILGYKVEFMNIVIYFFGLLVLLVVKGILKKSGVGEGKKATAVSIGLLGLFAVLSFVWTYSPPELGIFTPL